MGWFWADKPETMAGQARLARQGLNEASKARDSKDVGRCPVMAGDSKMSERSPFNPLNNMPELSHERQRGQRVALPRDRTVSTIPKGSDTSSYWEYPSPQQMYNAMIRKGKIDPNTGEEIPEDAVESMVHVHNFLNEGCWQEILEWERPYTEQSHVEPTLLKFTGRPGSLSPKARWNYWMGQLFPSRYAGELPFDRHDWVVLRATGSKSEPEPERKPVRYVLDFYGGPDDADGLPTFNVDVRPALDSYDNCRDRFVKYTKPIWDEFFKSA